MNTHAYLVEAVANSQIFHDYQRAFSVATGLSLSLRPAEECEATFRCAAKGTPFCALLASGNHSCTGCVQNNTQLGATAGNDSKFLLCPFGLSEAAVPVRLGQQVIGFLVTAHVLHEAPTEQDFERATMRLEKAGARVDREELRATYFQTPVVPRAKFDSLVRMLAIFAEHIALTSNEIVIRQANIEPVAVTRVKEFVCAHYQDDLSLGDAAQAAHTSTFHLCKLFRKSTGMSFTEFLSRTRVENAKKLLLRPNLRISEIAYEVGFQSLTHFNRVFRKLVGESPSEYRTTRCSLALAA